jgi:hypothetical protein
MYELIEHKKLDANAASITFTSIPQNYSDLLVLWSIRGTGSLGSLFLSINGSTANFSARYLQGNGSITGSATSPNRIIGVHNNSTNTFQNGRLHIPNYAGSTTKSYSADDVNEANATTAYQTITAGLWEVTDPITSLTITPESGDIGQYSSATLYGINRKSGIGRAPLAMGGYMSYSNGYWVHTFPSSGSFIPFTNMDVEYLVIGGGGAGAAGGGGAGGYRSSVIGELSGGGAAAEARLSLTANTNYAVTVGAGSSGGSWISNASNGSSSTFGSITSNGGGGGGGGSNNAPPTGGGSGGGAFVESNAGVTRAGASGTSGQGYAGGSGTDIGSTNYFGSGGGGGAGSVGNGGITNENSAASVGGNGGSGAFSSITGTAVARAGGGGGCNEGNTTGGLGGLGGGGNGRLVSTAATSGTVNTGGGGGGTTAAGTGGNGGSGIVIVRYKA